MNHMAEVAKMLGVELGEEFECSNGYKYILREDGIFESKYVDSCFGADTFSPALVALLNGEMVIKEKPWKPRYDERYWNVRIDGTVDYYVWEGCEYDICNYKLGNCYRTCEEAEADRNKWVKFYSSDEVLEV